MSSCFAFGIAAGKPIRELTLAAGTDHLWQGLPVLCLVLAGALTTNALWCAWLIHKNRSAAEFTGHTQKNNQRLASDRVLKNYLLAALGGSFWYFQFFSTPWAKAIWATMSFPAGPFTWPVSLFSPPCGDWH